MAVAELGSASLVRETVRATTRSSQRGLCSVTPSTRTPKTRRWSPIFNSSTMSWPRLRGRPLLDVWRDADRMGPRRGSDPGVMRTSTLSSMTPISTAFVMRSPIWCGRAPCRDTNFPQCLSRLPLFSLVRHGTRFDFFRASPAALTAHLVQSPQLRRLRRWPGTHDALLPRPAPGPHRVSIGCG